MIANLATNKKFLKRNSEPHRRSWEFYATEGKPMQP
jgi:hypothetical protein